MGPAVPGGTAGLRGLRPTAIEWVCLAAGVALTLRYAWLMDDAFVYFRYADNALFLKLGLVYNLGEYVEGYSSPLWMLALLALRALGLGYWAITRLLGVGAFVAVWAGLVAVNRRLSPRQAVIVNLPLCWLAVNYGALCNFTSGLETPLVQVAAVGFALFALTPGSRPLQAALAFAPLLRHELAAAWLVAWGAAWIASRRLPLWMAVWAAVVNGGWLAFRIVYYADLLPNTFYLKDGSNWRQGWLYLQDTLLPYKVVPLMVLSALCLLVGRWLWVRTPTADQPQGPAPDASQPAPAPACWSWHAAARARMLLFALPVLVYVVRIGGDHRHYRYLAFPLLLILCAAAGCFEALRRPVPERWMRAAAVLVAGIVLAAVGTAVPAQLDRHPLLGRAEHRLVNNIEDASVHRYHGDLAMPPLGGEGRLEQKAKYRALPARGRELRYRGVVAGMWCVAIYRDHYDVRVVHSLGLTEPILAHVEMKADRPAHKLGLQPLADDIALILRDYQVSGFPRPGLYEQAVREGLAPSWMVYNLAAISLIERKSFNRHRTLENLRLAFTRVPVLRVRPADAPMRTLNAPLPRAGRAAENAAPPAEP